ncbi:hypothetical protein N692_03125 [Lactiplantibacillus plantarum EGD-AQ4]|nr:hypothetical protein N692_03125 [Lactiplantibacillus plantarum EGD-AQ4]
MIIVDFVTATGMQVTKKSQSNSDWDEHDFNDGFDY